MTTASALPADAWAELDEAVGPSAVSRDPGLIRALSRDSSVRSKKAEAADRPLAVADAVVRATSTEQVSGLLRWANRHGVAVVARGLGSGVVGSGLPVRGGVVLDLSAMNAIGEVDTVNRTVTVGAGANLGEVDGHLAQFGLSVGHYPQSLHLASVGGCIAMRGSGTFSSLYGNIEDRIGDAEWVLPTGEVVQTRSMPRASQGIDLKQLLLGSEGMFGVATQVTLRLVPVPAARRFASVRYDGFAEALETVRRCLIAGVRPAVVRIYDPTEASAKHARFAQDAGWLLVLVFDGDERLVATQEEIALGFAAELGGESLGPEPAVHWEQRRFDWSWFTDAVEHQGGIAEAIEITAEWSQLPALYERLKATVTEHLPEFMAHVSHVYDQGAALYSIIRGEFDDDEAALAAYDAAWETVMAETLAAGARISHHHGIGLERARWMPDELGQGLEVMRSLQRSLDPAGIMNPGKLGL
ncbi:MAG: FAD-binding oxidoreductase [Micropruina sp.]|nr:FAD-binding oxidoreductase [Micropruina sp.]